MPRSLQPHAWRTAPAGPVVCVVMDGVGVGRAGPEDAVASAATPTLDWLATLPSYTTLKAHGTAVGMPSDADMGNSEVGHNVLGAGRVFDQGAKLVAQAIASGRVFAGEPWRALVARVHVSHEPLHFIGLLSDGNVHSHIDHLIAMVEQAFRERVERVRVHVLLDGRDVLARSALQYIDKLESVLARVRAQAFDYAIASGGGRMRITMDRYGADWGMVERGWNTHVRGVGRTFRSARQAVETLYGESDTDDQYLDPFVIVDDVGPIGRIRDGAAVVLFNFRGDRALEISRAFEAEHFDAFPRGPRLDVSFAGMMQYDGDDHVPARYLVEPPLIANTMGELLANTGKRQLAIAETQKFGHVTYFWNGNRTGKFVPELETYIEVPSDLVPTQQRPWMRAAEVTDALLAELGHRRYDFVRVNFANGDMVGHTGDATATQLAVETVDLCLGRIARAIATKGGILVVTADHGNADEMFTHTKTGAVTSKTSHTLNPVPFAVYDPREAKAGPALRGLPDPQLANVAATCLELLGLAAPDDFEPSLLATHVLDATTPQG